VTLVFAKHRTDGDAHVHLQAHTIIEAHEIVAYSFARRLLPQKHIQMASVDQIEPNQWSTQTNLCFDYEQ
jgi:hypothetical protein